MSREVALLTAIAVFVIAVIVLRMLGAGALRATGGSLALAAGWLTATLIVPFLLHDYGPVGIVALFIGFGAVAAIILVRAGRQYSTRRSGRGSGQG